MNTSHFVTSEIIQHIVDTIVYALHPHKILIFGSCANKKMKWDSDLDLIYRNGYGCVICGSRIRDSQFV